MAIKKIPEDTEYFHYYNANPKNHRVGDCVVRAISTVLGQPWEQTYRDLFEIGMKKGMPPEEDSVVDTYLKSRGAIRIAQPRKRDGTKMTGEEVCFLIQDGSFISNRGVNLSGHSFYMTIGIHHASCIKNGRVNDIWNCSRNRVGKMWAVETLS